MDEYSKRLRVLLLVLAVVTTILVAFYPHQSASHKETEWAQESDLYLRSIDVVPEATESPVTAVEVEEVSLDQNEPKTPERPQISLNTIHQYAKDRVDDNQWDCLYLLWQHESGWNPHAQNPVSTAYGIAQFLNSTWAGTGYQKTSDYKVQIEAGLVYISNRYGTPCNAWQFFQNNNWY